MRDLLLCISIICVLPVWSQDYSVHWEQANKAYEEGQYTVAALLYSQLDSLVDSPHLDYNLGNAYFKSGELGSAILYYERAFRRLPHDEDIRHNLEFARMRTIDKVEEGGDDAFRIWWRTTLLRLGADAWALLGLVSLFLALAAYIMFKRGSSRGIRQTGFSVALIGLIVGILFTFFSFTARSAAEREDKGVIMLSGVKIMSAPSDDSTELFILNEGTKVQVLEQKDLWINISLPNGNEGWLPSHKLGII